MENNNLEPGIPENNKSQYRPHHPVMMTPPKKKSTLWIWLLVIFGIGGTLLVIFLAFIMLMFSAIAGGMDTSSGQYIEKPINGHFNNMLSKNKIAVIEINGMIADFPAFMTAIASPASIEQQLYNAEQDNAVKAIIIEVNSPGGGVTASDAIYESIKGFKKRSRKPVVIFMQSIAASGGYYISAPADYIVAMPTTITGSIGVIAHTYNMKKLYEEKLGIKEEVYVSGANKDLLSATRDRTEEDRKLINKMITQMFDRFKGIVISHRKSHGLQVDNPDIFDGRTFIGDEALELGLVDEVGYFEDAVRKAKTLASVGDARIIRYKKNIGFFSQFGESLAGGKGIDVDININLPTQQPGMTFMYLWHNSAAQAAEEK